ncbi:condensin subunit ScpA [Candidatus Kryptonium thompsonii]|jgi:segregation and condensation protein A|uniref:Segregation and condensation protein A n=1 Tax=Candidatus Kryptonium thompsonii TaxID=1633631 RepID=A0A0P1MWT2_9BACT|nr:segregation/condensation protein A [Candidatus Kryptonium thompsoni]CUS80310.1 condensin subunit ScpA [Candidatus Kryptonium thompsoni]CUS81895.1 condensin subunit ScpA [Candidatus Kryptonium thompsoni]CUS81945.1 condensin subunit ScpA [Candidatus Kryptonium thompsoni]CUS82710.1 condensin subunit ScpA [Candidatus Kryptonium thompsoni]CUS83363.1 condensin subunit ScpA [Candidatus Kryptonium thompsoni]
MKYKVKLPYFEGPLDLLLFFVKRDELNIYDIPISKITKDFLEYIHFMQMLDLEIASEFIVMASTLMQIKAKMLLPKPETDTDEEEEDPRTELVKRLLEYKKFKELANDFSKMEDEAGKIYYRQYFKHDARDYYDEEEIYGSLKDVSLFDLISAFKKAFESSKEKEFQEIEIQNYRVEDEMENILNRLKFKDSFSFNEILRDYAEKLKIIVAFLAILELAKLKKIKISQNETFGEIFIERALDTQESYANAI